MNKINEKKVNDIIHTIGLNNNLTDSQVREIIESQFRFTYKTIRTLQLSGLTDEEIDNLKTNFYYKYIGKLYTNSEVIKSHNRRIEHINRLKQQKEDGRSSEFDMGECSGDNTDIPTGTNV